ncbi:hypothetical protein TNCV_2339801 [Trichonephila clavipes]|nr:hypothetical protein TNCV_2339801 [Trichonephila clavipes]
MFLSAIIGAVRALSSSTATNPSDDTICLVEPQGSVENTLKSPCGSDKGGECHFRCHPRHLTVVQSDVTIRPRAAV